MTEIDFRKYQDFKYQVFIPWPSGDVVGRGTGRIFHSTDPNHLVRPWLEEEVGVQTKDWNWDVAPNNQVVIGLDDSALAVQLKLQWC